MLKRIHIKGYKSLDDVEATLEPLTVLFGANASAGDGVEQSSPRGRMNPTEPRLGPRSAHRREEPHVG